MNGDFSGKPIAVPMLTNILPEFQQFLVDKGFASKKHAPFYARWTNYLDHRQAGRSLIVKPHRLTLETYFSRLNSGIF